MSQDMYWRGDACSWVYTGDLHVLVLDDCVWCRALLALQDVTQINCDRWLGVVWWWGHIGPNVGNRHLFISLVCLERFGVAGVFPDIRYFARVRGVPRMLAGTPDACHLLHVERPVGSEVCIIAY